MRFRTGLLAIAIVIALTAATNAAARPLEHVTTAHQVCRHGTRAVWHVAYETFGRAAFHDLDGTVTRQATPGAGRPDAALRTALQQTANTFGEQSRCNVGLRFDVYWSPRHTLAIRQEPYARLRASDLPVPTPAPGGPRRERQFFSRYDSVMEQFTATDPAGRTLLGPGFEGETFGYVSEMDTLSPTPDVLVYELLQGMSRFFVTRGAHLAPNPGSGIDADCTALRKLGYRDTVRVSTTTCTSSGYAKDLIAGTVPVYHGITHHDWRRYSVSRSWRRHHTVPAGLPAGHGQITSGAGPH